MKEQRTEQFLIKHQSVEQAYETFHALPSPYVEICIITEGNGMLRISEETVECQEGDLYLFDAGFLHGFFSPNTEEKLKICTVAFRPEYLLTDPYAERERELFCYGIFQDGRPVSYALLNGDATAKIQNICTAMEKELQKRDLAWEEALKAHLTLLLLTVSRYLRMADTVHNANHPPHPKEWATVSQALREVMENFGDSAMTLGSIAKKLYMSKSHLSRMFHRVTGSNFADYVRDLRLEQACLLLRTTRLSNEEIVRKCGLKDIPSFYRLFRTYIGMTPYQYRMTKHSQAGETKMSIYNEISENLQKGKAIIVKELVAKAIEDGLPAGQILNEGLVSGMNILGEKFKNNEVYVPEVLVAARAMNAGMQLLKPILVEDGVQSGGKVCIGTVQGDLHDIGKNLVKMMMEGKGLEVIDLGTDVSPEAFVQTAKESRCQVVCCSALLTTTMDVMADVVKAFEADGSRKDVKIMIGGAPITEEFCKAIGADCYTSDAASAADAAVELCKV